MNGEEYERQGLGLGCPLLLLGVHYLSGRAAFESHMQTEDPNALHPLWALAHVEIPAELVSQAAALE